MTKYLRSLRLSGILVLALCVSGGCLAHGTVTQVAGTVSATRADGTARILGRGSSVEPGDVLDTQKDSYALVRFSDGGTVTLKPNTRVRIDGYAFEERAPEKDNLIYSLVKGGLRALSGLIGKRGNPDAYRVNTATATIGIRGTSLGLDSVAAGEEGDLEPGVYLVVFDGVVVAFNEAGFQAYQAGQFGFMASLKTPPQVLPFDPGFRFTPPPGFSSGTPAACVVH